MSRSGTFGYVRIELPVPLPAEAGRAALNALASMSGHPRLVLEARGEAGQVSWYLGGSPEVRRAALRAISPHLPDLRTGHGDSSTHATAAAVVRAPGHRRSPLNADATDEVAQAVLGALSQARKRESVRLQVVLGPRHRPRPVVEASAEQRSRSRTKLGEHRFSCELRIGSAAEDSARAGSLIQGVIASLRPLEAPGVALRIRKTSLASLGRARDPLLWPLELGVSELTALLGWPIGPKGTRLPGVPPAHPRLLPVASKLPETGRILGVSAIDDQRAVAQGVAEASRVLHVVGPIGTGKSTMAVNLALDDAAAGRSVVFIDGKGDAVTDFMERLDPKRHSDVIFFNPTDPNPVGIPVFGGDPERDADVIFGVIKSLYGDQLGPRSSDLAHAAILTLARAGGCSLAMLPLLLSNAAVRRPLVAKVAPADPIGLGAFWAHFEALSDAERAHVVAPLRNKLDPILSLRPSLRAMFGQPVPRFSFRDLFMDARKRPIVLISLGSADLGPEGARLLGSVLLALIWQAAQQRTKLPQNQRHPVMLYLDEFQEIVRLGDLGDALGRARGLGVAFAALAHQSLSQLTPTMRAAVMAHARSRVCFQLSPQDAKDIAATTNGDLTAQDFQELPAFTAQASLLAGGDRTGWCTIKTRPLPPVLQPAEQVRAISSRTYGRPIAEVEADLLTLAGWGVDQSAAESFGRSRRSPGAAS